MGKVDDNKQQKIEDEIQNIIDNDDSADEDE